MPGAFDIVLLRKITAATTGSLDVSVATQDAAYKLAFSGFLRCGEFTVAKAADWSAQYHLSRGSVQFFPSIDAPTHVALTLPGSKTDPFRHGVTINVAAVPGEPTCPVAALAHLFRIDPRPLSAPLFCDANGDALTRAAFISRLKGDITAAGENNKQFSGHSFRRGAATTAAQRGFSDFEIQELGRWKSDAYKLYIDAQLPRVLQLSALLHLGASPAQPPGPPSLP